VIVAWGIGFCCVAILSLIVAVWCYFDLTDDFWNDEKKQRKYVRAGLLGLVTAPVWPLVVAGLLITGLVVMFKFAFPREREE
jgi:predicted MFS family arabinose efflux permease